MPYFVALDAGGTKTRCWVADDERVLGRSTGPSVKLMNVGEHVATRTLHELITAAASEAGVELQQFTRTCMGLAGISSETVRAWAETALHGLVSGEVVISGDETIAFDAAFRGGPGVLVIAGTGSNIVGQCSDGTRVTAGGWGPVVGDEGSGSWIGVEAVRAGLLAYDRGYQSSVLDKIREFWELRSLGELIAKANGRRRPDFAELTGVVVECAAAGDVVAQDVLHRAGEDLAEQVALVMSKMKACGCAASDGERVAFTGSILEKIAPVREAMESSLLALQPNAKIAAEAVEPLEGALWRARGAVKG